MTPLLLLLACQPDAATGDSGGPTTSDLWPGEDVRPTLDHEFFTEHPLPELSLYAHCEAGADRPDPAHRGPLAVGNGRVFGLLGLGEPLNSLHSMSGPTYEKGSRFFSDHWITLEVDGEELAFDRECIARPRGTSVVVTRADAGDVTLYTVDLAPRLSDGEAPDAIVRHLLVSSDSAHQVRLIHNSWLELETEGGDPIEWVADERRMVVRGLDDGVVDLGTVQGDARATLVFAFAEADDELPDTSAADGWLDPTVQWWQGWSATGVQLSSDDPRVEDLYDGLRTTLMVQTSEGGGIAPMSRYTGVWLRDTIGPVRFLLRAGLHDEARRALDYLHLCHASAGGYGNACSSGLDPDTVVDEPAWAEMGEMSGRTAAEGPSYVPLAWLDAAAWTGEDSALDERWDYVARGLLGQQMDEEGRQTFSGDETFRLMMNVAVGLELEIPWEELAWSANSSLLMKAAATRLAQAGRELGRDEDATALEQRAALADNALQTVFLQDGEWLAPFIFHTAYDDFAAGQVADHPYEDVNLKALWLGALDIEDPLALSDLETLLAWAGRGDGTVQSPPHASYQGADIYGVELNDGVCTGMVPGYTLSSLTAIGHPQAQEAFDALHRYAGPTGSFAEALLYEDLSALQIYYDQSGALGDIAARFRPWEGAIDLDAMLAFLLGAEPVDGGARFRPHLPAGHRSLAASGLAVGACRGDLEITGTDTSLRAEFTASAACGVRFELPVDGTPTSAEGELFSLPGGEQLVSFPVVELAAGEHTSAEVSW